MAVAKKKAPGKSGLDIGGALKRKLGPLPAWGWLALGAIGLFVYRRYVSSKTGAATSAIVDTSGLGSSGGGSFGDQGAGGGGGGGPQPDAGSTPVSWDPAQLAAQIAADISPPTPTPDATVTPTPTAPTATPTPTRTTGTKAPVATPSPVLSPGGSVVTKVAPGTTLISEPPTKSNPGPNLQIAVPPGATNIHKTPQGAVIYTAASGAVLEQAPGHSRYTVSKAPTGKKP